MVVAKASTTYVLGVCYTFGFSGLGLRGMASIKNGQDNLIHIWLGDCCVPACCDTQVLTIRF